MFYFDYELSDLRVGAPTDFYARSGELDLPVQASHEAKEGLKCEATILYGQIEWLLKAFSSLLEALAESRWHPAGVGQSSRSSSGGVFSSFCPLRSFSSWVGAQHHSSRFGNGRISDSQMAFQMF